MTDRDTATYLGATCLGAGRALFRVWAPYASRMQVHIGSPNERTVEMSPVASGYFETIVDDVAPGCLYRYRIDGSEEEELADPASRFQPEGVHGPSCVVDDAFEWSEADAEFRAPALRHSIFYELHVGAFTREGTFEAVIPRLDALRELGVSVIELMPVAQFPGERNWGYDGVFPFAVQSSYGGPRGLKRLVDESHRRGIAVVLDVVYNHLGPEGNVLGRFGPYTTDRYETPWGTALNFDGRGSDEVRRFFIANALYFLEELHLDGLRLDAVHAIVDNAPRTFLEELALAVEERITDRRVYLIPESAANDARLVRSRELGGYGMSAVWNDDFHHALHTLLTGERSGYYQDYGGLPRLEKAFREAFVYTGEHSVFRGRRHGTSASDLPADRFVVFAQNHDQVGNRMLGDRLAEILAKEKLKLAAGCVLLSPYVPLLFMGEEYGETARFPFFVSHSDPELIEAVRRGRKEEFAAFEWSEEPPDPQAEATFASARLEWERRDVEPHRTLLRFHEALIRLRQELPALRHRSRERMKVTSHERAGVLELQYWSASSDTPGPAQCFALFHFGDEPHQVELALLRGVWRRRLDSSEEQWSGPGSSTLEKIRSEGVAVLTVAPWSVLVYQWDPAGGEG